MTEELLKLENGSSDEGNEATTKKLPHKTLENPTSEILSERIKSVACGSIENCQALLKVLHLVKGWDPAVAGERRMCLSL